MGLKKTRIILSVILSVIIAASTVVTLTALVLNSTFATQSYLSKYLITDELVSTCEQQLDAKYAALEEKSGIPARVFLMIKNDVNTGDSLRLAVANLFSDESSDLYSQDRADYFYRLCVEYLEGNKIEYKEAAIRNVSQEATKIYSDSVGIHNADSITKYLSSYKLTCAKITSAGLLVLILCVALLTLLYTKREDALLHIGISVSSGGLGVALGALICLILKVGSKFDFSPMVYQQSFYNMTKHFFLLLVLAGIACLILAYSGVLYIVKSVNNEKHRKNSRFSKVIGRF